MTKPKATAKPATGPNNALEVSADEGERASLACARVLLDPEARHGLAVSQLHKPEWGKMEQAPGLGDYANIFRERAAFAVDGDVESASRLLVAQATTLDAIFTEMARRMALNMGEYIGATETYARIALKAQANSRATIEALAKLHQPREQTVRHVYVNEGAQAVIADEFHHHQHNATGGLENGKSNEQPHATGTGAAGTGAALPSPDPIGGTVPIPSGEGQRPMQDARWQG